MYRIELAPGEETVFRTIEELAVAVRNGLVTTRCRIYHNATQKWLPIEFHPHYKQALALPAARIAEAVAPRTSGHPPALETLSFAVTKSTPAPAPEPMAKPATETRAGDHPVQPSVQPRPQAEEAAQDHLPAKRPVGVQRVGQPGAERHGAERSDNGRARVENSASAPPSDTEPAATTDSAKALSPKEPWGAEHSPKQPSVVEHSPRKHSAAAPAGGEHSRGELSGADPSDARDSGVEHTVTKHAVSKHAFEKHAVEKHAVEKHAVEKHAVEKHAGEKHAGEKHAAFGHSAMQHSPAQHPVAEHVVPEQPAPKQPAPKQPAPDHPAWEHAATTHLSVLHTAADEAAAQAALEHAVEEQPSATVAPAEHPVTRSPYPAHPAAERLPASRAAAEHRFGPHADMAAAPRHPEPAPTPKSQSSYRPDSYLPPTVRVVPDAPYVATAPEPATAPPIHTEPVKAWPVMPAVQPAPELPTISYPEFTPAEEPVAEPASSSRGHRRLQVAVALLVLAAGGYLARSFYSPVRGSHVDSSSTPAAAVADRPALPEDAPVPAPSAVTTKPTANRPAVATPTAPASSGFAAALEPRAIATGPAPILARAAGQVPAASTTDSTAVAGPIAPAPAELQMDVPALPGGDSLVAQPRTKSDSTMKRILRAVSDGKAAR